MSKIKTIAEIEEENTRLDTAYNLKWRKEERYNNTVLDDEGVIVSSEIAKSILEALAPDKLHIECAYYYFMNDKYSAALVGANEERIGLFTVELPAEVAYTKSEPLLLKDTLDFFKNETENYKKVRVVGNLTLAAITLLFCLILFVAFGVSQYTAFLMLAILFACMVLYAISTGG